MADHLPDFSAQDFQLLVENQMDLVVKVDLAGRFLYVSPSYCRMFGLSAEMLLGKTFMPLVHEDDRKATADAVASLFQPPYHAYMEQRAMTAAGWRWLAWQDTLLFDEKGSPAAIIGVGRDITERKQVEQELLALNERLEQLVEQRTEEVNDANRQLTSLNEELAAINTELNSLNQALQQSNQQLEEEVQAKQENEDKLLLRGYQYHAATRLLVQPVEKTDTLLQMILRDALSLIQAPEGYIGLLDEQEDKFIIHYAIGNLARDIGVPQQVNLGLRGVVFATGETQWVSDYRVYPDRLSKPGIDSITTLVSIPLKRGKTVIGVFAAFWTEEPHDITSDEREILQQYSFLASVALERFEFQLKIQRRNELLRALAEMTTAVVAQTDLDAFYQSVLEKVCQLCRIENGFVLQFDRQQKSMKVVSARGRYLTMLADHLPLEGIGRQVAESGKLYYIKEYQSWPDKIADPRLDGISLAVQAPLCVDGEVVGSIGLSAFGEKVQLGEEELEVIEQLARIASIALKNNLLHQQTLKLATVDLLTGLPNRTALAEKLIDEMKKVRNEQLVGAILYIDLDDLKLINDNYGHSAGDVVIQTAGRVVVEKAGNGNFVARIGGDEFVVILSGEQSRQKASEMAEMLVMKLNRDYEAAENLVRLTASIGVAYYPEDGDSAEELLKNADVAMYEAKNSGKDRWCVYQSRISDEAYSRMLLLNNLRRALERNEFSLCFQPQVSCERRRIVGFEALLRWTSPEHGPVSPAQFIPMAEQSGLILSIGQFVLAEACRFAARLKELGYPSLRVAVNLSPRQLIATDIVAQVQQAVAAVQLDPSQLEIEVTENVFMESMEEAVQKLTTLRELGICLALDDFGTGYSSLTYLRKLPVDTLKIDKAFIDPILEDESQERFVRFIIEMAHSLNLQVVAEGVEHKNQVVRLERLGCDLIQGYVYSKPLPGEQAIRLLQDW